VVVTARGLDLEDTLAELKDGDIEGTAAEVEDEDSLLSLLIEPVGERRGGRLVDNALDVEARYFPCVCASSKYAGTVMTASVISSPRYSSASLFSFCRIIAEISGGE
jgi:hypothetical protein